MAASNHETNGQLNRSTLRAKDGFPVSNEEGRAARKALFQYVRECEPRAKGWEGELLDTDAVIERFGVTAEQLNDWRKRRQIICFGLSRRKRRYPAEQFTDQGGVAPGIDEVMNIAGNPVIAWHWLCKPWKPLYRRRPIDLLKAGDTKIVLLAAHRQFDEDAGW